VQKAAGEREQHHNFSSGALSIKTTTLLAVRAKAKTNAEEPLRMSEIPLRETHDYFFQFETFELIRLRRDPKDS